MSLICYHGRLAPACCDCDAERGKTLATQLSPLEILRELWLGSVLVAWWCEWPAGSEHPIWTGCLTSADGTQRELDSPHALYELLSTGLVERGKRLQRERETREWRLSDRGLAALDLPSRAAMRSVERSEKVLCG